MLKNASVSVAQTIVVGAILFLLYGFLLKTIGVDLFGVWSLVLATTSIAQLGNLGISGGVVKFVAKYLALKDDEKISSVIQTGVLTIGSVMALVFIVGYPLLNIVLDTVIPGDQLPNAKEVLPLALISMWLATTSGIFLSALDGYQRQDLRSYMMTGGVFFNFTFCLLIVPRYGLSGLAWSNIFQNVLVFVLSWIVLKRQLPLLPPLPFNWDRKIFREIIGYSINLQVISATVLLYEPVTKALLSRFGGLSMVGYYEMASRMVQQFRALLVAGNQVLVPSFAGLREKAPERITSVYLSSYHLIFYLALPLFSGVIIVAPLISYLWIGHYEMTFIACSTLLAIGWFLNILGVPAYFANLGNGELRWNVIAHIVIAALNLILGAILGSLFGGFGVVIGWVIALTLGSSLINISYHLRNRISFRELMPRASILLLIMCTLGTLLVVIGRGIVEISMRTNTICIHTTLLSLILILCGIWFHPMRLHIGKLIRESLIFRTKQ